MTRHNISGSERPGPHVVIRQFPRPRRGGFLIITAVQFIACALFVSAVWAVLG